MSDHSSHLIQLEKQIRAKYECERVEFELHGQQYSIVRVKDIETVLAAMEARFNEDPDSFHEPYWGQIWESAIVLSEMLNVEKDSRVLDLGCGIGLTGVVAASMGARVTFADAAEDSLIFAQLNSNPYGRHEFHVIDWKCDRLANTFDWILASDLLYDSEEWEYLESFWRKHLSSNGRVMIAEPSRPHANNFCDWLEQRGWWVQHQRQTRDRKNFELYVAALAPASSDV